MAALLVQRIFQNKGMLQTSTLALELLLSTGFFSALLNFKRAINPSSLLEFSLSIFRQLGMSYKDLFALSSLRIFFFINSVIIILILVSSRFHRLPEVDVFVGNNLMDSLNVTSAEILVADDDAPPPLRKSKETTNKAALLSTTLLENLGLDQELLFLENDDGEVTLKDIQVDSFRTRRVMGSSVDVDNDISKSYEIIEIFSGGPQVEDTNTMEATWNAISQQGRHDDKSFKLKKSESARSSDDEEESLEATWKELRKTVTFNDAVSVCRRGGLARDDVMSTSSDEMKKRFDDFINNFNNHLRLQRQESQQRRRLLPAIAPTPTPTPTPTPGLSY